jgi:hypothetical protein
LRALALDCGPYGHDGAPRENLLGDAAALRAVRIDDYRRKERARYVG